MKMSLLWAIACTITSLFCLSLRADDVVLDPLSADGDTYQYCEDCGHRGSWIVDCEATFLRYHRNDNLYSDNIFGFELSPRIAVGYQNCNGVGVRGRYWAYDHTNEGLFGIIPDLEPVSIRVDTYNIDLELYKLVQLTCDTSVEVSGGIRYNDFSELVLFENPLAEPAETLEIFNSYGALFGLKGRCQVCGGAAYARLRMSILMGDQVSEPLRGRQFDQVLTQTELSLGYEYTSCVGNALLTFRTGMEYWYWTDYVHDYAILDDNTTIGFGGFVLGATLQY